MLKFIIITIICTMINSISYTQNNINENDSITVYVNDTIYPKPYFIDNEMVGVIFSIEQARKINNDYEIYSLMDSLIQEYNYTDSISIYIIDNQNKKINALEMKIVNYTNIINNKNLMLDNRNDVISELNNKIDNFQKKEIQYIKSENSYKDEIKYLKKEIRKQKTRKIVAYIATGVVTVGVLILSILK